jgi:hypothetical protein
MTVKLLFSEEEKKVLLALQVSENYELKRIFGPSEIRQENGTGNCINEVLHSFCPSSTTTASREIYTLK